VVHGDDLVAATYGRAFWILDDVTPLRQINPNQTTTLFRPEKALRVRLDLNQDTPLPPEMPAGQNPPTGAIIDFFLASAPRQDIKLGIYDSAGKLIRELDPKDEAASNEPPLNVPDYWVGHPDALTEIPGHNRFVWDLRSAAPPVLRHEYAISALYGNTPGLPLGSIVTPGTYTVRLTADGKTYEQPLVVAMDPRVDVSSEALNQQLSLENKIVDLVALSFEGNKLNPAPEGAGRGGGGGGGGRGGNQAPTFAALNRNLASLLNIVDQQDAAPTPVMEKAYEGYCTQLATLIKNLNETKGANLSIPACR
jgi:hypothetical protein